MEQERAGGNCPSGQQGSTTLNDPRFGIPQVNLSEEGRMEFPENFEEQPLDDDGFGQDSIPDEDLVRDGDAFQCPSATNDKSKGRPVFSGLPPPCDETPIVVDPIFFLCIENKTSHELESFVHALTRTGGVVPDVPPPAPKLNLRVSWSADSHLDAK